MRRFALLSVAFLLVLGTGKGLSARPFDSWSDDRLWKEADVVLIGVVKSSEDVPADRRNAKPDTWVEVDTTFEVSRMLQGKLDAKTVVVRHRRFFGKEPEVPIVDGPAFVEFNPAKKNSYMIFLKKPPEGEFYEPLTGQLDPWQSFVQQVRYHVTNER